MKVPGWITFFLILLGIVPEAVGGYYNHLNQRTRAAQAEGTHWKYGYDSLGQVTSGKKYWNDGTPVAGQQFEYAFDEIGNRLEAGAGGDGAGGGLRYANYTPNGRNGYATREVPGAVDVYGAVNPAAEIAINGSTNVYRRNEYYHGTVTIDNSAGPVYQAISTTATLGSSQSIHQETFVPQSLVTNAYDLDGNLLSDGVWTNRWDAENRLIQAERIASAPAAAKLQLKFSYDFQGRRIHKRVFAWNSGAGAYNSAASTETKFVYDGWNLLAELSSNNSVVRSYVWGLDAQGRLHTASGAGALAVVKVAGVGNYFPLYDGSGNVRTLVDATTGAVSAEYDYGAFGESVQATGLAARASPFRQSTKYTDDETGWVYYGYRYYSAETGRWLSEDPLGESGGLNLYAFLGNDPVNGEDLLGLILFDKSSNALLVFYGRMADPRALWENIVSGDTLCVASSYSYHVLNAPMEAIDAIRNLPETIQALKLLPELIRSGQLKCILGAKYEAFLRASPEEQMESLAGMTGSGAAGWATGLGMKNLIQLAKAAHAARLMSNAESAERALDRARDYAHYGGEFLDDAPASVGARGGLNVATGMGGEVLPMTVVKTLPPGTAGGILNKAKALTFSTGNEHALVRLATGERALVSGGPGGISFAEGQVTRIIGHTHPYRPNYAGPSPADFKALNDLGQTHSYVIEAGQIIRINAKP